ncbi:hypothetical protein F8M41_003478 [Gigaspora margarita]|uniref:Uncharacterized protein n=1 Tax=Gigaspora margarita TaxID=4874 RepID=A0A8H3XBA4_GIGMA|nr:hypothetical protein F8M41_003478 [Gigaspora margarita]
MKLRNPEKKVINGQYEHLLKLCKIYVYGRFTHTKYFPEKLFPIYYDELPERPLGDQTIHVRKSLRFTKKPSNYHLTCQYIKKQFLPIENNYNSLSQNLFENLYKSSIDIQLASPISVHSNSTYINDGGFVEKDQPDNNESLKPRYIIKQNGNVNENKINFSDEELRMDDNDDDDLISEEEALKFFFTKK